MDKIYRLHYRGQLNADYKEEDIKAAVENCKENIRVLQKAGKILTAALYHADRMLFLYYEAVGKKLGVVEPLAAQDADGLLESGEDIQADVPHPMEFLAPLTPYLAEWPGQCGSRKWVYMYRFYYHSIPENPEQWKRTAIPRMRRGRIAFLREDKLFSYLYHHEAIAGEGLLTGDKYQSIAIHENILFSYFEEPKTITNARKDLTKESQAIEAWLAVNPESHFIHMPQGEGENFMFLPALFALGVEELL